MICHSSAQCTALRSAPPREIDLSLIRGRNAWLSTTAYGYDVRCTAIIDGTSKSYADG